jgi:thiamine biosynthesis protein ThiS
MKLQINGEQTELPDGTYLDQWLTSKQIECEKIVVERNQDIIFDYKIPLQEGDILEIIRMVGGG